MEEEAVETTAAPATTAAAAEEAAPSGPAGVYKMAIFSDPQTQNIWKYYDSENDFWTRTVMTKQSVSLFTVSEPNKVLITEMADELVESSTDNGDGTWSITIVPSDYYNLSNIQISNATNMGLVFRNENGSQEFKDYGCSDFFIEVGSFQVDIINPDNSELS